MVIFSPVTSRKRYLGWLAMGVVIMIYTIIRLVAGDIVFAAIVWNVCVVASDLFLAYYWYGEYKEAKNEKELKRLNNREKFLREIKSKKW